ncbi:hypothetical protein H634G_11099 [Metarhizium anisopliae BRIP 53293]|uniref:Chromo domain-containing protein n=1 Tax=Metarhizium anisopliae BRIP 53293 TaxID=1291518 RepID=A0A0D9NI46_METAN|nr:hypothetical protein H634G_11099 [Metarhizium anisopliae BRIP 53293]
MAFPEHIGRGNRYNLRAHRPQPGSAANAFESYDDVDFTINSEPSGAFFHTNGVGKKVAGRNGNWYTVQAIKDHMIAPDGTMQYCVKWKGCGETTWEPEESLIECVPQFVMRYSKCIARRKKIITKKKRKRLGTTLRIGATKKRQQQVVLTDVTVANRAEWWYPLLGSWRGEVHSVDCIEQEEDKLIAHVTWLNGKKTRLVIWRAQGDET